jgi:hypothetical protein
VFESYVNYKINRCPMFDNKGHLRSIDWFLRYLAAIYIFTWRRILRLYWEWRILSSVDESSCGIFHDIILPFSEVIDENQAVLISRFVHGVSVNKSRCTNNSFRQFHSNNILYHLPWNINNWNVCNYCTVDLVTIVQFCLLLVYLVTDIFQFRFCLLTI